MVNGNMDPLRGIDYRPDVLLLHASDHVIEELRALADRRSQDRPPVVVVGDDLPLEAARHAMRAGARDIIGESDSKGLAECLHRLSSELAPVNEQNGRTIVVVNGKGGSGATFIATSLACLSAADADGETVVVDLDFQYGSLPHYLDVKPKRGLLEALANANDLDEMAVSAYAVKHPSGLHVMAPLPDVQVPVDFEIASRVSTLFGVLRRRYRTVIVDLPRHLDLVASQILPGADQILIVLQQSLLAVHDGVRLKSALVHELSVPAERIVTVVNRHSKASPIELDDLGHAMGDDDPVAIPNQFRVVSQSLDVGESVVERAPNAAVTRALQSLHARVMGQSVPQASGFIAKTVLRLRG